MQIVGKTEDGQKVVSGVFKLFDTLGLPLEDVFTQCKKNNYLPSWTHFYNDAMKQGWKHKTIMTKLKDSMYGIYEDEWVKVVLERIAILEVIE